MQTFRNLKISKKLMLSFFCVILIAIIIGGTGIYGISTLSAEDKAMYNENTKPIGYIAVMYDTLASQRICANNMVIFLTVDPSFSKGEGESLTEKEALFDEAFTSYQDCLSNAEEENLYNSMKDLYYNDFTKIKQQVRDAVKTGDPATMAAAIQKMDDMGSQISGYMDEAYMLNDTLASDKVADNQNLKTYLTFLLIGVMIAGAVIAVILAIVISRMISRPINRMLNATKQVAQAGDLHFSQQVVDEIRNDATYHDETGELSASFSEMMESLIAKTNILEVTASGDLTSRVTLVSERDTIGNALEKMLSNLNQMFNDINASSHQVSTGSKQIADGAQTLAQGATEQAATVQELSNSIAEVAEKTKDNAEKAEKAARLAETIKGNAEKGSEQMSQMIAAVEEISEASDAISKVIKVIDDIAFQTNILALNAAVEAARAGTHGKGFAVVAEEVRNLAQKSSDSAKDTGMIIENSIQKTALGVKIAGETSESLVEIVQGINESSQIVREIARSSDEQNAAISEVNRGIDQVALVVQQNSATAEQSAAASEEMSGQASILQNMVSQFKIK